MKKISLVLAVIACIFLIAWCGRNSEKPAPSDQTERVAAHSDKPAPEAKAEPAANQRLLTYRTEKNGTIEGANPQVVDVGSAGTPVTAAPDDGYHFVGWSDGAATPTRTDSAITTDLTITAIFALNQYTLTYTAGEAGSIEGATSQTVVHGDDGAPVTALPAENHRFVSWSDGVTTANRAEQKVSSDISVVAEFALNQYTLTYTAGENGHISGEKLQRVAHGGAARTVTAVPADGHYFVAWSDGVTTPTRTDSHVQGDLAVTANFAASRFALTYTAEENGTIQGLWQQAVEKGGSGTQVTAVAGKGYRFAGWSDGVTTAQRTDKNIQEALTVSAKFEINAFPVGGTVSGLVKGTQLVLQNNGGDDFFIKENGKFSFPAELPDASDYDVRVLVQPISPSQICQVTGGAGKINGGAVDDIIITCAPLRYPVGGSVAGLPEGDRVILLNNERDEIEIGANGPFLFATSLDDGSRYEAKVAAKPRKSNWTCAVENAAGALAGKAVDNIRVDCYPEAVLKARPGMEKAKLSWNSGDFSGVTFDLCRAQEEIPSDGFSRCRDLKGGVLEQKVNSQLTVAKLINNIPYWFQLEARYDSGRRTLSKVISVTPFGGLNDTGIDWCADNNQNRHSMGTRLEKNESCNALAATYPGQDAFQGRDALARIRKLTKSGSGEAGFDFTKLCRSGEAAGQGKCPPNPMPGEGPNNWACTRDNVTGLIWEIKSNSGTRSNNHTYTWYNPDGKFNGGNSGVKNGGKCEGSECDTRSYIQTVNDQALCGARDWRLPTKRELLSIVDNSRSNPAIDTVFFPDSQPSYYWSSSPLPDQENSAWQVYFLYGEASPNSKDKGNHVRLVRGRILTFGLHNPN
jgi:hypothetical protein